MLSLRYHSLIFCIILLLNIVLVQSVFSQVATPDFSVVIIPDPQNLSAMYPDIFKSQTQWVVNNVAALNIRMVIGEGDMVNHDALSTEWANADAAVNILNGKVPYAFAIGNHDYDNQAPSARGATQFNAHFGPLRYASYEWYGGNYQGSNENFYTFFSAGSEQYMVLVLEFYPRTDVITWAHSVLNTYPEKRVIVVTHSFEGTDGMRVDLCDTSDMSASKGTNPQLLWSTLLKQHPNVFLVLSGHLIGNGSARRSDLGDQGNLVHQMFTNFQDWTGTKAGYLRILTFHPAMNTIDVVTYSPWTKTYLTSPTYQFTLPLRYVAGTQTSGAFQGKVRSSGCIRIAGAQVSAAGYSAVTDANGVYNLPAMPAPNSYPLTSSAFSYADKTAPDTVSPGFTTQTNFFLDSTVNPSCALNSVSPSVTICSPVANSTVVSPVRINAGTRSSKTLAFMQIYIDGIKFGTYFNSAVDQNAVLAPGAHRITVQAMDTAAVLTKSSMYVNVANAPAVTGVTITSPVNNATIASPIPVRATATAATGSIVSYTKIYLDGVAVYTGHSAAISADVPAGIGTHRLTVQVCDSAGVIAKSTVYVTVK